MSSPASVTVSDFGSVPDAGKVHAITLSNGGVTAEILSYGATIHRLLVPRPGGQDPVDVALGFDNMDGYLGKTGKNPYFGAVVGRVANRIAGGRFTVGGKEYRLAQNNGENALHGGLKAMDKEIWAFTTSGDGAKAGPAVTFTLRDADGNNGYPGNVSVSVTYTLSAKGELSIRYEAETDAVTPINLTNHCYFNLAGHAAGTEAMLAHRVTVSSDKLTAVGPSTLIPTGELAPVEGTRFDLRQPKTLKDVMGDEGFDHNYCLAQGLVLAARVEDPASGRSMSVYTDQPGVQFYTGNFMPEGLPGKSGAVYGKQGGFCLETQDYPDAVNQPTFPSVLLRPGSKYCRLTRFAFNE